MIENIFPTKIFVNTLDIEFSYKQTIISYIENFFLKDIDLQHSLEKGGKSTFSVMNDLHCIDNFKPLVNSIEKNIKDYWNCLDFDPNYVPYIDTMWANEHKFQDYTNWHTHSTHILSGVFYLKFPRSGGNIVFYNPLEYHTHYYPLNINTRNKFLQTIIEVVENVCIIFPSHLKHKTEPNFSQSSRLCIAFNINYKKK